MKKFREEQLKTAFVNMRTEMEKKLKEIGAKQKVEVQKGLQGTYIFIIFILFAEIFSIHYTELILCIPSLTLLRNLYKIFRDRKEEERISSKSKRFQKERRKEFRKEEFRKEWFSEEREGVFIEIRRARERDEETRRERTSLDTKIDADGKAIDRAR